MRAYLVLVRIAIAIMLTVSALHMALGIGTAKLLDPGLPDGVLRNAVLDSQDRFYGSVLGGMAVLGLWALRDVARYQGVITIICYTVIAGALMRLVSLLQVGMPGAPVLLFTGIELVLPLAILAVAPKVDRP